MTTFTTLKYDGEEKALTDWNLSEPESEFLSGDVDVVTLTAAGRNVDLSYLFPYGSRVELFVERTLEPDGSFSGGTPFFQGTVTKTPLAGTAESEAHTYEISGPWFDLTQITYRQRVKSWNVIVNFPDPPTVEDEYLLVPSVYLNQSPITGEIWTTGQQIQDVLDWAIARGAMFTYDTTNFPSINVPIRQEKPSACSEIIRIMLRLTPDAVTWFTYDTGTPIFHCQRYADLPITTIDAAALDPIVENITLNPRYDLQRSCVALIFEQTDQDGARSLYHWSTQVYPPGFTGLEPGALVDSIELEGFKATYMQGRFVNENIPSMALGSDTPLGSPETLWWQQHVKDLSDPRIKELTINQLAIVSTGDGEPNAELPRNLIDGALADWMGYEYQEVEVSAQASYKVVANPADGSLVYPNLLYTVDKKLLTIRLKTNNGPVGEQIVSERASIDYAEPEPAGLAEAIYNAISILHYDGGFTLVSEESFNGISIGQRVNLTGARTEWATMGALIQSIHRSHETGKTEVVLGTPGHLGAADYIELLRMYRTRRIWRNPKSQLTGLATGQGQVKQPDHTPDTNSASSDPPHKFSTVKHDTDDTHKIILDSSKPAAPISLASESHGLILVSTKDLYDSGDPPVAHAVRFREIDVCVAGETKKMIVLCSLPYNSP